MKFSFKRVFAIVQVRNKEFYRDFGALGWVFLFPLIMVVTFGYIFDVDKGENYKVGYWGDFKQKEVSNIQWVKYKSKEEAIAKLKLQRIDLAISLKNKPAKLWLAKNSPKSKMAKKIIHLHTYPHPKLSVDKQQTNNFLRMAPLKIPNCE